MRRQSQKIKLLFWIWPFGAFLMAIRSIRFKSYHPIILGFSFIYGYSVYMYSGDIVRYTESFQIISRATWHDFFYLLQQSYTGKDYGIGHFGVVSTQPDIYALALQFFVSRITENCRWFFAIVSLIYTYFFLILLNEVLPEVRWIGSFWQKIFFAFLLIAVPFYYPVSGVRFWPALCIFIIFALRHIKHSKPKDLIWASTSLLFHFSFILPITLLILSHVVKLSRVLTIILIVGAVLFFTITTNRQIAEYAGRLSLFLENTTVESRITGYTSYEYIMSKNKDIAATNWYARWNNVALPYFLITIFLTEFLYRPKFRQNKFLNKLYPLYILFFTLTMFTINLGPVGRYHYIFDILSLARLTTLIGINPKNNYLKVVSITLFPILILHVAVTARAGLYTVDPLLLCSPAVVMFFTQSGISLSELLVGH